MTTMQIAFEKIFSKENVEDQMPDVPPKAKLPAAKRATKRSAKFSYQGRLKKVWEMAKADPLLTSLDATPILGKYAHQILNEMTLRGMLKVGPVRIRSAKTGRKLNTYNAVGETFIMRPRLKTLPKVEKPELGQKLYSFCSIEPIPSQFEGVETIPALPALVQVEPDIFSINLDNLTIGEARTLYQSLPSFSLTTHPYD